MFLWRLSHLDAWLPRLPECPAQRLRVGGPLQHPTTNSCLFFISDIPLSPVPSVIMHNPRQRGIRCDY